MQRRRAFSRARYWRNRRLAAAAIAASIVGTPPAAAQCVTGATTIDCSGNLAGGVAVTGSSAQTLNVNNLTTSIAPPSGTDGILFQRSGTVFLNAEIMQFVIATSGAGADGVHVEGAAVKAMIFTDVTTQGDGARGVFVAAGSGAFVQTGGDIVTSGLQANGIEVSGDGPVSVLTEGNVTVKGLSSTAIRATTSDDSMSVTTLGNIVASGDFGVGIHATGVTGATVITTGDIFATQTGIRAETFATSGNPSSAVSVTSVGNITTGDLGTGIIAYSEGSSVNVLSVGNIVAGTTQGIGIEAEGAADRRPSPPLATSSSAVTMPSASALLRTRVPRKSYRSATSLRSATMLLASASRAMAAAP